jgi:hypothetical protein
LYQEQISSKFPYFFPEIPGNTKSPLFEESVKRLPVAFQEGLAIFKSSIYESFASVQAKKESENLVQARRNRAIGAKKRQPLTSYLNAFNDKMIQGTVARIDKVYKDLSPNLWGIIVFILKANLFVTSNVTQTNNSFSLYLSDIPRLCKYGALIYYIDVTKFMINPLD